MGDHYRAFFVSGGLFAIRSPLYLNPAGVELLCITVCVHINVFTLNVFSFLNSFAMGVKHQHFLADSRGCKREALDLLVYKSCSLVLTCKQNSRVCGKIRLLSDGHL